MRTAKKVLSVFLVCVMILCSAPLAGFVGLELPKIDFGKIFDVKAGAAEVVESGSWGENVTYTLDSDGLLTISGTGNMLLEYEYAPWYPNRTAIKKVIIEDGVTNISDYAFLGCTELVSITIPSSVKWIGWLSFDNCTSLAAVSISDIAAWCNIYFHYNFENPLYCANNLYLNGELVTELIIPETVTTIQPYAFNGCTSLTSVTIPSSVTSIEMGAFGGCSSLEEIIIENKDCQVDNSAETIPSTATIYGYAGSSANFFAKLNNCPFVSLDGSDGEIVEVGSCGKNLIWALNDGGILTITGTGNMDNYYLSDSPPWNSYKNQIKTVIISVDITTIGANAFKDCINLETITIPNGITSIGQSAFANCSSLQNITIPDSVTIIGRSVFNSCSSLQEITIPNGVTDIENYLFENCSSLQRIIIPQSVTKIGSGAFKDCCNLQSIDLPNSITVIESHLFNGCTNLQEIEIPETVTSIGNAAFAGCKSLQNIRIPDSVTTIGESAFSRCESLQTIEIPDGVVSIEDSTFTNCSSLQSVYIPDSVAIIGDNAFSYCGLLQNIAIPNRVTSIAKSTFFNCDGLRQITLPDSVTSIGNMAFSCCSNLSIVILGANIDTIEEDSFAVCNSLRIVGYANDENAREDILISDGNNYLLNATWYYNICKTEHTYSGNCDSTCDVCNFPRTVSETHTYTNSCDDSCDVCGAVRYVYHTYTDECDSICNVCNYEREIIYDYTITTDEEITLTYSSDRDVEFVISDTSVAYVRSTGKSSIVVGSYASIKTSATITPKKPGSVIVSVVDSYNNVLTKALLLINEGEHQLILSEVVSEQNCVNPKEYIYKCKFCTYEEKVYEDPLGHTYTNTCDPICDRCFAERTDIKHTNTTNVEAVEATCSAVGYTAGVYCNDCENYISGHEEIAAIGHDYNIVATAPTCTEKGVKIFTCITCGNLYAEDIDAIGHSEEIIPAVAATCTQTGLTQGTKCTVCGEILVPQTEIPVLNHADENTDGYCDHCATLLIQLGDVDGDGQLTSSDARAALRAAVGLDTLTTEQKNAADTDGDNNITSADARLILRAAVGLEDPTLWAEKLYSNI